MLSALTWMDLEIIMIHELSQKEKDKYHIKDFVYQIQIESQQEKFVCTVIQSTSGTAKEANLLSRDLLINQMDASH